MTKSMTDQYLANNKKYAAGESVHKPAHPGKQPIQPAKRVAVVACIHHTRCGMLAFTDDLLKAGLEGDPAAEKVLGQATGRKFVSCGKCASTPSAFHAFRGAIEPLDSPRDAKNTERLQWDVRRGMSAILNHPWLPTSGADAVTVRGFVYDVDTGKLDEVSYPGPTGSFG
jgi:carbonic anhydrase